MKLPKINPQTMQVFSLLLHAGWSLTLFLRPHLFESYRLYSAFSGVMPTLAWAWLCGAVALLLLIGWRWRPLLVAAHLLSCFVLLLIAVAFWLPNGLNTGLWPYAIAAVLGFAAYTDELTDELREWRTRSGK